MIGSNLLFLISALVIASGQEVLPKSDECGTLNSKYMYNQKTITELDEFPWMGRIVYEIEPFYRCLAVLISKRFLIANAHCHTGLEHAVVLGDWNIGNNISDTDCDDGGRCAPTPMLYEIETFVIHPDYSSKQKVHDIAVVQLSKSVNYSNYIRPICLPPTHLTRRDLVAKHLQLTGWYISGEVKKAKSFAQIMSRNYCEAMLDGTRARKILIESNSILCANSCGNSSSSYLSGSALMGVATVQAEPTHYYLVGIDSYGSRLCPTSTPSVLMNIVDYLEWIKENIS